MSSERDTDLPKMSSVLGATAVVIGNATGKGDLEIRGRVQGDVLLQGRAFVAEGGIVLGRIEATDIVISGQVRGDLNAFEGIVIHPSGDVEGNLEAPRVTIVAGARVRGSLRAGESQARAAVSSAQENVAPASIATPASISTPAHVATPEILATPEVLAAPIAIEAKVLETPLSPIPSDVHPSRTAELPRPRAKGRPKAIPSFQKGARAELKDAE